MTFHVDSEVGRLRRVVLHRPGLELQRLTPANCADLLFDDVLWVKRARQEHDAFADALRDRGVEVLYLAELLAETLVDDVARKWVLERTVTDHELGPMLAPHVRDHLLTLDAEALARVLIGGLVASDIPGGRGLAWATLRPNDLVLPPLPNHLFTRDTSCWIYGGVSMNPMAKPARRREAIHLEAIYSFHPSFTGEAFDRWYGGVDEEWGRATLEGGDVLVIGNDAVLIGMGERTRPAGVSVASRETRNAASNCSSGASHCTSNAAPSAVRLSCRVVRANSRTPSCASRRATLRLTATAVTPSAFAAPTKLPSRAACTKLTIPRRLCMGGDGSRCLHDC